jgi:hypothetical protein
MRHGPFKGKTMMLKSPLTFALIGLLIAVPGMARAQDEEKSEYEIRRENRLRLDFHPIGTVIEKGELHYTHPLSMHPAGFRADEYRHYLSPTYGLGDGWEVGAAVTGAERIGRGGNALFYGLGAQKQFIRERKGLPAVSIGAYGMIGPHNHHTGNVYLAATKRVWQSKSGPQAMFLHGGVKGEFFTSDDYKDDGGVRPFFGANFTLTRRFFLSGEVAPAQDWERETMWSLKGTYLVSVKKHKLGVSGGIRNNGYETHPFIGVTF